MSEMTDSIHVLIDEVDFDNKGRDGDFMHVHREVWRAISTCIRAPAQQQALGTGNLASDPLCKALDALYSRGWADLHKGHDHDPRGTTEWQAVLDLFRTLRAKAEADVDAFADGFAYARQARSSEDG